MAAIAAPPSRPATDPAPKLAQLDLVRACRERGDRAAAAADSADERDLLLGHSDGATIMAIPPTPILSYGTRSPHRPRWRALRRRDSEGGTPGGMNNKGAILIAVALAGYGVLSISMTLGFKSALSAFPYPCALVAATFVLEAALVKSAECGARCSDVVHARKCDGDDASNDDGRRWLMLLIGACVGGEVALSNAGLLLLSVATHTMIKACTPVFVLAAALALGLEPPSCASFGIVATIASGTALSSVGSAGDGEDSLIGVLLTVGGGAIGGLRWGLTQRATQTGEAKVAPTALVRRTLPFSAACLVAAAAAIDGYRIAKAPGAGAAALDAMGVAGALAVGGRSAGREADAFKIRVLCAL